MWQFLFLLLPIAAYSGWLIGRRALTVQTLRKILGLNTLFQRTPSVEAVGPFSNQQESVETHLALGGLFRRQGEVDKAVGIHKKLINQVSLSDEQKALFLLELSRDYMRAGVLDRAESVLIELTEQRYELDAVFQLLLDIYQQSKDWVKAIQTATMWQKKTRRDLTRQIAHFYCELAEQVWLKGEQDNVRSYLQEALRVNTFCVRASLLLGHLEAQGGEYRTAIESYKNIQKQDKGLLTECIMPIARCYDQLDALEEMLAFFEQEIHEQMSPTTVVSLSEWLIKARGLDFALQFMTQHLQRKPSLLGMHRLLELKQSSLQGAHEDLTLIQDLISKMISKDPRYRCHSCGFSSKTLQWQCPSCKQWDMIKPVYE